jgi:hypothetical protein
MVIGYSADRSTGQLNKPESRVVKTVRASRAGTPRQQQREKKMLKMFRTTALATDTAHHHPANVPDPAATGRQPDHADGHAPDGVRARNLGSGVFLS